MNGTHKERTSGEEGRHWFRPWEKLLSRFDYQQVKRKGKRLRTSRFVLNFASNDLPYHRLGLVVQKRFWKQAVRRNRVKRCLREWFRLHKDQIPLPGKDIVVIPYPGAEKLTPRDMAEELLPNFNKKG